MSYIGTTDPYLEIVKGKVAEHAHEHKFGRNPDIDTGSFEAIWNGGGDYTGFDATGEELAEHFSSDATDAGTEVSTGTATGGSETTLEDSGAGFDVDGTAVGDLVIDDTLLIHGIVKSIAATILTVWQWQDLTPAQIAAGKVGAESGDTYRVATPASTGAAVIKDTLMLDGNYASMEEYVILNGVTGVDSVGNVLRLSRSRVILAGSDNMNAGTITVRQKVSTDNIFIVMPIGEGRTMICAFTIPAGKHAFFLHWGASLAEKLAAASVIKLRIRPVGQSFQTLDVRSINSTGSSDLDREFDLPKDSIPARTDIFVEADSSINNNAVSAHFDLLLIDN